MVHVKQRIMKINYKFSLAFLAILFLAYACEPRDEIIGPLSPSEEEGRLDSIPYNPVAYVFPVINGLPAMEVPASNPLTVAGVRLGRFLFYEKLLSIDSSISCGSCHQQDKAFTDGERVGVGVGGTLGTRNSMMLINVGYNWKQNSANNFLWDGHFRDLEDQVLAPVEHPLEMMNSWDIVETRLQNHPHYPRLFREAFGITYTDEITRFLAAKALAQFLRTLNSAYSKYDSSEFIAFNNLSDAAQRGMDLFLGELGPNFNGRTGECAHCHSFTRNRALFARNNFSNNAIDSVGSFSDFSDNGLGGITGNAPDNGRFREVSLRNIALTAPYMHDGRFATLEEVLDHYVEHSGTYRGPNVASDIAAATTLPTLTQNEKQDIIAFLNALTDTSYFNKTEWSDPFLMADPWAQ